MFSQRCVGLLWRLWFAVRLYNYPQCACLCVCGPWAEQASHPGLSPAVCPRLPGRDHRIGGNAAQPSTHNGGIYAARSGSFVDLTAIATVLLFLANEHKHSWVNVWDAHK